MPLCVERLRGIFAFLICRVGAEALVEGFLEAAGDVPRVLAVEPPLLSVTRLANKLVEVALHAVVPAMGTCLAHSNERSIGFLTELVATKQRLKHLVEFVFCCERKQVFKRRRIGQPRVVDIVAWLAFKVLRRRRLRLSIALGSHFSPDR